MQRSPQLKFYYANKERLIKTHSEYKTKNKVKIRETTKRWEQQNIFRVVLGAVKRRAKLDHLNIDLTPEYLEEIWTGVCPVFKTPIEIGVGKGLPGKKDRSNVASLDRMDSTKGYIKGNVQWMSWRANAMKSDATPNELKIFADWIKVNL